MFELAGILDRSVFSGQRRQVVTVWLYQAESTGFGQQRAAFANRFPSCGTPPDRRLLAVTFFYAPTDGTPCRDRVTTPCTKLLKWLGVFRWTQAFLLNIYHLSVRVLFSTSSALLSTAAAAYSRLQIKAPVTSCTMLFWLHYWGKMKEKAAFECTFATQQHRRCL